MTALLTRLRIAGFKSFAEPAALDILPGLTGIVGPNGCGKSNVVEALRWAMGESSARSLRGGEMDDVIFAGTAARASRNLAEVTITLQSAPDGALPDPFAADEELQVTRRIERGAGSHYRANGRELRARDVQTLFADMASGARSSAMVSQGRVAALVNARPEERRMVLEEAAGITGLHARRHEAELKLRAAEANLGRAEELRVQLEAGREGLRRQARQASRYRAISGLVRSAEAEFLGILHARALSALRAAEAAQKQARQREEEAGHAAARAAARMLAEEAALPGPREQEAASRSLLERRRLQAETMAGEAARAEQSWREAVARLAVLNADLAEAAVALADAEAMRTRLDSESASLIARRDGLPAELGEAEAGLREAARLTADAEAGADRRGQAAAEAAAAARAAAASVDQAGLRLGEADRARAQARRAAEATRGRLVAPDALRAAQEDEDEAESRLGGSRDALAAAAADRETVGAAAAAARLAVARESGRAEQAARRLHDAESRLARSQEAVAMVTRELAAAEAALVDEASLLAAAEAAGAARVTAAVAAGRETAAEAADGQACAAERAALAARDRLAGARTGLLAAREEAEARLGRLCAEEAALAQALAAARSVLPGAQVVGAARDAEATAGERVRRAASELAREEAARAAADLALAEARAMAADAAAALAGLTAEADGMRRALGGGEGDQATGREAEGGQAACDREGGEGTLLDGLDVPAGLEAAFGAFFAHAPAALEEMQPPALGQPWPEVGDKAATAPAETRGIAPGDAAVPGAVGAPTRDASFWRVLPALQDQPPPPGCTRLDAVLGAGAGAPAALARALAHAALLDESADGHEVQAALKAGWVVVSRHGDIWRWDGQVVHAGAPNAAAARLLLRARLRHTLALADTSRREDEAARGLAATALATLEWANAGSLAARRMLAEEETGLAVARRNAAGLLAQTQAAEARLASLTPSLARLDGGQREAEAALADAEASLGSLPQAGLAEQALFAAAAAASAAREALVLARTDRAAARATVEAREAACRDVQGRAARAESLALALRPQRERSCAELAEAAGLRDAASDEAAALPDLALLRQEEADCNAAEEAALAALRQAELAVAQAAQERQEATQACLRLEHARAGSAHAHEAAQLLLEAADAAHGREEADFEAACALQAGLGDSAVLGEAAAAARADLTACRAGEAAAAAALAAVGAALEDAEARAAAAAAECFAWTARQAQAAARYETLVVRRGRESEVCAALEEAPPALAARAAALGEALVEAETLHGCDAACLREAEERLREAERDRREAEATHAGCREILARGEGAMEAAACTLLAVRERAAERLGPDVVLPATALPVEAEGEVLDRDGDIAGAEDRARRKLDRLQRERDEMGPVNLRAELELGEADARLATIDAEREELATAIARLRGGIGHLNREGRERLTAVFAQVDQHFRALFTRMMGGGRAHLALTGADDPLQAGLEIYAEPPGKKLSALSLLSGGEQALTALSLIFAVFRCTPAPVAVLDEVDAPLDDMNVERFCGLLDDMVRETGTRFLVVTHHQLTMSRMDRLFGVTMQERGVSRLLSVDLRRAAEMVEEVLAA